MPQHKDPSYWINSFNTQLSQDDEQKFMDWINALSLATGRNRMEDLQNYDMRGYYIDIGKNIPFESGHFPDIYKKPNHPTFSIESKYHGYPNPSGGTYQGGQWGEGDSYTPSSQMLQETITPEELQQYFQRAEPNANLIIPERKQ